MSAQSRKVYRIGVLSTGSPSERSQAGFLQALRELGYHEGKNAVIERRYADGRLERLPALAASLAEQKVDVIQTSSSAGVEAARKTVGNIPIVFVNVSDPVARGFVASLARPGGNITGISNATTELAAKRLQLLKEAFPAISRVGVLNSSVGMRGAQLAEIERAAKILGMQLLSVEVRGREDMEKVSALLRDWRADSMLGLDAAANHANRHLLTELASDLRLPAIWPSGDYADAGGLMHYGAHWEFLFRRGALYVDKILKGAKPAELPVELPTRFQLTVNLKTAQALGIALPPALVGRADRVIE